jgi:hypothetical protein
MDISLSELIAVLYCRPSATARRGSAFRPHWLWQSGQLQISVPAT